MNIKQEIPHFACLPNERNCSFGRQVRNDNLAYVEYGQIFGLKPENLPAPKQLSVIPNEAKRNEESTNHAFCMQIRKDI